jgi:predicted PurR-regulated permease PerM
MKSADAPSSSHADEIDQRIPRSTLSDLHFAKRVIITLGIGAFGYFLWLASDVLLLVFASLLFAILLRTLASSLHKFAYVGERWALPLATILFFVSVAAFVFIFGAQVGGQLAQLTDRLPEAIDAAGQRVGVQNAARQIEDAISAEAGSGVLSRITRWSYSLFGALGNVALVLVAAVYFAADPGVYRRGFAMLFPPDQQERVFNALDATGGVLRHWLGGQLLTMLLVGGGSALAYWMLGLPSPIALGLIAGVTNFIPFLGPFMSAIPPLVFAFAMDTHTVLWTLAAVVLIQQMEGNVITPLIQKRAVALPPALGIFAIIVFGVVFGIVGVFLAVPLAAAVLVLVRNLWVRETLQARQNARGK